MQKTLITCIPLLFLNFFLISPKTVFAEVIKDYSVNITVNPSSQINVSESILYDFGSESRHGIFRDIPYIKTNQEGNEFGMSLTDFKVYDALSSAGTSSSHGSYQYSQSNVDGKVSLKIGDPNTTLTGKHNYTIDYKVAGAITYFDTFDELYWNAIGPDWKTTIESAQVTLALPKSIPSSSIEGFCYTGASKSSAKDCSVVIDGSNIVVKLTKPLNPYEGLTVVAKFPIGYVEVVEPQELATTDVAPMNPIVQMIIFGVLGLIAFSWYLVLPISLASKWIKEYLFIQNNKKVVSAWFSAPKLEDLSSFTPAEVGYLVRKNPDLKLFTATIISLAQRGFFKIRIEKNKTLIFTKEVFVFDKTSSTKTGNDIAGLQDHEIFLYNAIFNNRDVTTIDDLSKESFGDKFTKFNEKIDDRLVSEGLFTRDMGNDNGFKATFGLLLFFSLISFNVLLFIATILWSQNFGFTQKGVEKLSEALSLKNFLVSQNDQLDFQALNQMFFEKLLPYATAFGVEDVWVKRFKDLEFKQTDWYEGNAVSSMALAGMSHDLSSSIIKAHAAATQTSSTSGFSSGSSSGFSGGGGGGGGGGSW